MQKKYIYILAELPNTNAPQYQQSHYISLRLTITCIIYICRYNNWNVVTCFLVSIWVIYKDLLTLRPGHDWVLCPADSHQQRSLHRETEQQNICSAMGLVQGSEERRVKWAVLNIWCVLCHTVWHGSDCERYPPQCVLWWVE